MLDPVMVVKTAVKKGNKTAAGKDRSTVDSSAEALGPSWADSRVALSVLSAVG